MWLGTQPCCLECSQLCFQDPVFAPLSHHSPGLSQHPFVYAAFWLVTPFSSLTTPPSPSQYPSFPFITPLTHLIPLSPSPCPPPSAPHLHTPTRSPFTCPYSPLTPHFPLPLPPCFSFTLQASPCLLSSPISFSQCPKSHSPKPNIYMHTFSVLLAHSSTHLVSHSSNKDC